MNNSELADQVATDNGLTKADARKIVDGVFAAIVESAGNGEEISLNGFGKFKVKDTPAREGRNPSTGAAIRSPPQRNSRLLLQRRSRTSLTADRAWSAPSGADRQQLEWQLAPTRSWVEQLTLIKRPFTGPFIELRVVVFGSDACAPLPAYPYPSVLLL